MTTWQSYWKPRLLVDCSASVSFNLLQNASEYEAAAFLLLDTGSAAHNSGRVPVVTFRCAKGCSNRSVVMKIRKVRGQTANVNNDSQHDSFQELIVAGSMKLLFVCSARNRAPRRRSGNSTAIAAVLTRTSVKA